MGTEEGLPYGKGHLTRAVMNLPERADEKSHLLFLSDLLAGASHWSKLTRNQRAREPVDTFCTGQPPRAQSWVEKGEESLEGCMENVQKYWITL